MNRTIFLRITAAFIFTFCVGIISFVSLNDYGIVWDEPIHFVNGDRYWQWFTHPDVREIPKAFRIEPKEDVHPPLRKWLASAIHDIFTTRLNILEAIS